MSTTNLKNTTTTFTFPIFDSTIPPNILRFPLKLLTWTRLIPLIAMDEVKLLTRGGSKIRVCCAKRTRTNPVVVNAAISGCPVVGYDPEWPVSRRLETYKMRFGERLRIFGGKESSVPMLELIQGQQVFFFHETCGLLEARPERVHHV